MIKTKIFAWVAGSMLVLILGLSAATATFKTLYDNTSSTLANLQASVEKQNTEAADLLKQMTADRDQKQALLDEQAKQQEQKDNAALVEIERLAGELDARPVRVLYVTAPAGQSGGSSPGEATADSRLGAEDGGTAYGVLPEANSRRLNAALTEVEQLNAAYRSCKDTLVTRQLAFSEAERYHF